MLRRGSERRTTKAVATKRKQLKLFAGRPLRMLTKCSRRRTKQRKLLKDEAVRATPAAAPTALASIAYFSIENDDRTQCRKYFFRLDMEDGNFNDTHKPLEPFSEVHLPNSSVLVGVGSRLYNIGGYSLTGFPSKYVYSYDTNNNINSSWIRAPDMKVPRLEPKVVVVDDMIFVIGGIHPSSLRLPPRCGRDNYFSDDAQQMFYQYFSHSLEMSWAEFLDPKDPEDVWKPVKVRKFDKLKYEHPLPSLFPLLGAAFGSILSKEFHVWKDNGHRIVICVQTCSYIYNIRKMTLKTFPTGNLYKNIFSFFGSTHLIGDQVLAFDSRSLSIVAHNLHDGNVVGEPCPLIPSDSDPPLATNTYATSYPELQTICPVNGSFGDDATRNSPLYFLWVDRSNYIGVDSSFLNLIALMPSQGKSNCRARSTYFCTPPGRVLERGALLYKPFFPLCDVQESKL